MTAAAPIALEITVTRREVHRLLGYGRNEPSARVAKRLDELWDAGLALLEPRGLFRFADSAEVEATDMPRPSESVVIGLCTVGSGLEEDARRRGAEGELLDELLLDSIGSVAAEAAADAVNRHVCERARERGLFAGARISPGYGSWDVARQRELLALLPADELGVSLTSGCMMVPRKSVSFAVRLGARPPARPGRRCERCGLESCSYRQLEDQT